MVFDIFSHIFRCGIAPVDRPRANAFYMVLLVYYPHNTSDLQCISAGEYAILIPHSLTFQLFEPSNRQTDRVRDRNARNIPPVLTSKFPLHLMVSAAMSANAVLELHILPQKCTVNPKYYVDNILAEPCKMHLLVGDRQGRFHNEKYVKICRIPSSNSHSVENGSTYSHIKIEPGMVPIKFSYYYVKEIWSGNSPDLSPIIYLWAVIGV